MKDSPKKNNKTTKIPKSRKPLAKDAVFRSTKNEDKLPLIPELPSFGTVKSLFQQLITNGWFVLPVVSLFIILLVLTVYTLTLKQQLAQTNILPSVPVEVQNYPFMKTDLAPDITAESAIIVDDTSKVILFQKKPQLRFSMASTTKIMTALVVLETFRLDDIINIYQEYTEGAVVGFQAGEKLTVEEMLYALLLPSANDAAYSLAENYPGGSTAFIERMNQKAKELNLTYTHYADAAGLDDDGNYTTVTDLVHLASYAMTNQEFRKIIATKNKVISTLDGAKTYKLMNLNKLLGENGVIGIKTGYTEGAGEVLVTSKIERGHLFIIVVMKSENRFEDTRKLLTYISNNITFINPGSYLQTTNKK